MILSQTEYDAAASLGQKRQLLRQERKGDRPPPPGKGGTWMERNAIGAVAEYALAKAFGPECLRDWCETKAFSLNHKAITCDCGANTHVRATTRANGGLILHDYDPDDGAFVLAIVDGLSVTFPGWLPGKEAKQQHYWRCTGPGFGQRPAYCVPQEHLFAMESLPEECK